MGNSNSEETELATILESFKRGVFKLFNGIAWLIKFSISKALFHILFIAVGVGLGFAITSFSKSSYVSIMTIDNTRLENDFCNGLIGTLTELKKNHVNDELLAKRLNLDVATIQGINSIKYKEINEKVERIYQDSLTYILPFRIEVKTNSIDKLDTIQAALLNYLESNEYATKLKQIDERNFELFEKKLDQEMQAMDSLKQAITKSLVHKGQTSTGVSITESVDPARINEVSYSFFQRKLSLYKAKMLNNSFNLISGLKGSVIISGPSNAFFIFDCALVAYLISLFILLVRHFKTN